jgi:hypothetical protein
MGFLVEKSKVSHHAFAKVRPPPAEARETRRSLRTIWTSASGPPSAAWSATTPAAAVSATSAGSRRADSAGSWRARRGEPAGLLSALLERGRESGIKTLVSYQHFWSENENLESKKSDPGVKVGP